MTEAATTRRGRGRRPAAEVRAEVLATAGNVFVREGIRAATFERIAKESGASKTTLYRWWPSSGALAAEAFFTQSGPQLEFPDTGDLRADLVLQLTSFVTLMTDEGAGRPISELIGAAQMDPDLAEEWSRMYSLPRRELARDRLRSAQRIGQLPEDADLDIIIDQLWGACYHRMLVLKVPLETLDVERLVASALRGAR
ncbi:MULTISPECIES: TetR/AcrR family transcriptional regulator [Brevibacterium]|uniref:Transcriptional regulator, TetR family n=1 Tax=Brevibacterium antiquum CNRZ 918 TaxID=1255637 RepID=A0A2H1I6V7_9MICO|nr:MULTISPECIES: TetR/AcrR family transcriptional regulator [Brevibacterium]SMX70870.1 transcriptional regulator, TetR family [Brevibacterium antiquum CNRZ 918]HCG55109.1 TetR family transcriptional regulator [Brevibacterium sp.]